MLEGEDFTKEKPRDTFRSKPFCTKINPSFNLATSFSPSFYSRSSKEQATAEPLQNQLLHLNKQRKDFLSPHGYPKSTEASW